MTAHSFSAMRIRWCYFAIRIILQEMFCINLQNWSPTRQREEKYRADTQIPFGSQQKSKQDAERPAGENLSVQR